jgi:hypothetical protein
MNRRTTGSLIASALVAVLLTPAMAFAAHVGVGVNLGKIDITDKVVPGGIYKLPSVGVVNTGDTVTNYKVTVVGMFQPNQKQPDPAWFQFTPATFSLKPGETQQVGGQMTIPLKAQPGSYFGFIQAQPVVKTSGVSLGVAAATKLTFMLSPSNWFAAMLFRLQELAAIYSPWSYIVIALIVLLAIAIPVQRRYKFSLGVQRRDNPPPPEA